MRIVVVGLRGFPNIQGGIETHCEELYPRIAQLGHEVIVVRRSGFVKENPPLSSYKGVKFKDMELIGIPYRITVGRKAQEGILEFSNRYTGEKEEVSIDSIKSMIDELYKA